MDPVTTIGLASSIVQLITFTSDLVSKGREIYKSANGSLVEHLELESIVGSLVDLSDALDLPNPTERKLTSTERQLSELCDGCKSVTEKLLDAIRKLKAKAPHKGWQSFRQALNSAWKESEIAALESRLDRYRRQIDTTLLVSLRENMQELLMAKSNHQSSCRGGSITRGEIKQWQSELVEELRRKRWNVKNREDMEKFAAGVTAGTQREREARIKLQILEELRFTSMDDRFEGIPEAHRKTFEWLFMEDNSLMPKSKPLASSPGGSRRPEHHHLPQLVSYDSKHFQWSNFVSWLQSNSTLYWVTGKAGSGKSTLMKYLFKDLRTWHNLLRWRGIFPLITAGFFFWNSGTVMQMSTLGLLQTLLHDSIKDQRELIPTIFPNRWRSHLLFGGDLHPWTMSELVQAFEVLVSDDSKRFFYFVDGLDEFDGDSAELVEFIFKTVSPRANVKMCVASRPWLVFEDAFKRQPSLKLEDLTASDIHLYVAEKLRGHDMFVELQVLQPKDAESLIMEVTEKAGGVFLWVYLVVSSLLQGLRDGDCISDLHDRLLLLPSDLEKLFSKILNGLNPTYFKQASLLFQIVRAASQPVSLFTLSLAEDGFDKALSAEIKPLNSGLVGFRGETMRRRLNSRCKGLLEAPTFKFAGSKAVVQYLHRTVRDFMSRADIWDYIVSGTGKSFDPDAALSAAMLLQIKTTLLNTYQSAETLESFWQYLELCVHHAIQFESRAKDAHISIVMELERVGDIYFKPPTDKVLLRQGRGTGSPLWYPTEAVMRTGLDGELKCFFDFAFRYPLHSYVEHKLNTGYPMHARTAGHSLLHTAACARDIKILKILFDHGADPNDPEAAYGKWSPWHHVLWKSSNLADEHEEWADIILLFLDNGSDTGLELDGESVRDRIGKMILEPMKRKEILDRLPKVKKFQLPVQVGVKKEQKEQSRGIWRLFKRAGAKSKEYN